MSGRADKVVIMDSASKPRSPPWTEVEVQYLRDNWEAMTSKMIANNIGRSLTSVKTKGYEMKLTRKRGNTLPASQKTSKPFAFSPPRQLTQYRKADNAPSRAADFLRINNRVPMYRCNLKGAADHSGSMWRYGNAVLSDDEVVAKARRKGWDEDAWKRLP